MQTQVRVSASFLYHQQLLGFIAWVGGCSFSITLLGCWFPLYMRDCLCVRMAYTLLLFSINTLNIRVLVKRWVALFPSSWQQQETLRQVSVSSCSVRPGFGGFSWFSFTSFCIYFSRGWGRADRSYCSGSKAAHCYANDVLVTFSSWRLLSNTDLLHTSFPAPSHTKKQLQIQYSGNNTSALEIHVGYQKVVTLDPWPLLTELDGIFCIYVYTHCLSSMFWFLICLSLQR